MKLFHFASQNTSQTLLRWPCHDSPRLNSPSKHVGPCYLFALIDGRSAALAARSSDSPLSDLLPLLPSAPRELTLTLLDRNVFTANSLWIFQWRMCWNDSSGNYRSGSRRGRTSNQEVTRWHTNAHEICFVLSFCTFLFHLLWTLRGNKRAVVDVIEFCALFVDLRCDDLKRKPWEMIAMPGYITVGFAPFLIPEWWLIVKYMVFTKHRSRM